MPLEATESRSLATLGMTGRTLGMTGRTLGMTGRTLGMTTEEAKPHVPSESQRRAIEALIGPVLVLAGPGAGKTFCLAERIRYLVEVGGADAARICAFTFTNKAAGEIAARLAPPVVEIASHITGGTIHVFWS